MDKQEDKVTETAQPSAETINAEIPGPVPYDRFVQVTQERAELAKRLKELDAAEAKRQQEAEAAEAKKLEEQQKWQELADKNAAKAAALEAQLQERDAKLRRVSIEKAFQREVKQQGLSFVADQAADTAFGLLQVNELEVDDSGAVVGLDKALKALAAQHAYLFVKTEATKEKPPVMPLDARTGLTPQRVTSSETNAEQEADWRQRFGL